MVRACPWLPTKGRGGVCVRAGGGGGAGRGATVGGAAALEVSDCARYPPPTTTVEIERTSARSPDNARTTGSGSAVKVVWENIQGLIIVRRPTAVHRPEERVECGGSFVSQCTFLFFFFYNNNILYTPAYTTAADVTLRRRSTGYYTRSRRRR